MLPTTMLFDTHCHLANKELKPEADALAERAKAAHVGAIAIIAADEESLRAAPQVAAQVKHQFRHVVWTAGVHPHDAEKIDASLWQEIEAGAQTAHAIGETGLDYYYDHSDRAQQRDYFDRHIQLACRLRKPLVIHCRNAASDVLGMLDQAAVRAHGNPGILHCFTEELDTAKRLLDWGFYISFSGILTFKNADKLRGVAKYVPLDRLLIETDSPWLAPIPQRGKRCEPAFVAHTYEFLRTLRPEGADQLQTALWANSCRVYQIPA